MQNDNGRARRPGGLYFHDREGFSIPLLENPSRSWTAALFRAVVGLAGALDVIAGMSPAPST
jgi:hypothetical protein